jgi:hypothetical protein
MAFHNWGKFTLTVSPSRGLDTHLNCYAFSVTVFNFGEYNQGCRSKIRVHGSQANFNAKSCFWMCGLFVQGPCFMPFLSDGILGVVSYSKEKRRTTWKNPGFHGFLIIPNLCTESSSSGHSIVSSQSLSPSWSYSFHFGCQ